MYDQELVREVLRQIESAAIKIIERFKVIHNVSDFTDNPDGVEKMDAISMRLIVVGEALKNLDKITSGTLLPRYPEVDWKKAKGMRDILTHHYDEINAEAIFLTCRDKIPMLLKTIQKIIKEVE